MGTLKARATSSTVQRSVLRYSMSLGAKPTCDAFMPGLRSAGRIRFDGSLVPGLPAVEEAGDLIVGWQLGGLEDDAGGAVVGELGAVADERVAAHVQGQTHRGYWGHACVLFERIEVAQADDLVRGEGHRGAGGAGVHVSANVVVGVGDDAHPVGAQGPHLERYAVFVALDGPVCDAPEVEVGLGGAPEVAAGPVRVGPIEEFLRRVVRADPLPARFASLDDLAVDLEGRPGYGVGAQPDGGVHGDGS